MEPITGPVDPLYEKIIGQLIAFALCIAFVGLVFLALRGRGGSQIPLPPPPEDDSEEED